MNNTVSEFAPGSTTPTTTLTELNNPFFPNENPWALAFDGSGNLYVANLGNGTVSKFAPGSTTPTATLTESNNTMLSTDLRGLAFDSSGNLYVANGFGNTVSELRQGARHPRPRLAG